jgi:NADPH:quinone reductase-like Zn-dependent oxidoreductase
LPLMSVERQDDLRLLGELAESGKFRPAVDRRYSLVEAPDAVRYVGEGHARGKVVVTI